MHSETVLSNKKIILSTPVVILALAASFATCYFSTPTVFGGRDQGAIATAAINLVKHKSFTFSTPASENLFQKYGPGKSLNFPGFDYTKDGKLITRFPKVYIIYLAGLYSLFSLKGIQFANFIPLFLFFILFWLTLHHFFSEKISFLGFLLAATFFPFLWFAKYTLTEIFMLFLVWAGIYFLIKGSTLRSKKVEFYLYLSLAFFGLSALTRIEGIAFFLLALIYIFILNKKKNVSLAPRQKKIILSAGLILFVFYLILNYHNLSDSLKNIVKAFLPDYSKESRLSAGLYLKLLVLSINYNLLVYAVGAAAAVIYFLARFKKNYLKAEWIPFIILFPALIYLLLPLISLDDPWMLRRYVFAVFPLMIFYTIWALDKFFVHRFLLYLSLVILIISNSFISFRFITLSENKELLPQIEKISADFGPNDLILVDRLATDSGWSLMSEPLSALYGKQAVYFFNADDLKAIDESRYQNIYLIAPFADESAWHSGLAKNLTEAIVVDNNYLEPSEGFLKLPTNIKAKILDGIWKIK